MANLILNGQTNPANMLCFSDTINIAQYYGAVSGTQSMMSLTFPPNMGTPSVSADSQYYITILDETITNVTSPSNANNKRFFIGTNLATAAYVARALAECDSLAADWYIYTSSYTVILEARTIGNKLNVQNPISTNIPSNYLSVSTTAGTASLNYGGKILLNVSDDTHQLATLEKNKYQSETQWNISPVIGSIAEYGKTKMFKLDTQILNNNGTIDVSTPSVNAYVTPGYLANQSEYYLYLNDRLLINNKRGASTYPLYLYGNKLDYSILATSSPAYISWYTLSSNATVIGYDVISTSSINGYIADVSTIIPSSAMTDAYYVELEFGRDRIRFNVIKPLRAAEGATRIYWRNEYGGISFFDFTGKYTETDTVDVETYQKNFYDFYNNPLSFEEKKIYKNNVEKEVTVKSHLMPKNGTYIANSLFRSKRIWTVVNANTHYLLPINIEVNEEDNYNDIYTITFTYKYSTLS